MNEETITEVMRLAGLMATARCQRMRAAEKGPIPEAEARKRVDAATAALRNYLEGIPE